MTSNVLDKVDKARQANQQSRFLQLPKEVLLNIYTWVLGTMSLFYHPFQLPALRYSNDPSQGAETPSLLRVCRQFYLEASPVFFDTAAIHIVRQQYSLFSWLDGQCNPDVIADMSQEQRLSLARFLEIVRPTRGPRGGRVKKTVSQLLAGSPSWAEVVKTLGERAEGFCRMSRPFLVRFKAFRHIVININSYHGQFFGIKIDRTSIHQPHLGHPGAASAINDTVMKSRAKLLGSLLAQRRKIAGEAAGDAKRMTFAMDFEVQNGKPSLDVPFRLMLKNDDTYWLQYNVAGVKYDVKQEPLRPDS